MILALVLLWLTPDFSQADPVDQYFYQGYLAATRGDYDQAIPNWNAVLRLNPNNVTAFKNRGLAYLHKDDYVRSINDYSEVIRRKPNDIAAFDGRGYAYFQKQDWAESISDFEAAIRLNPGNAALYLNLGRVYLTTGAWNTAITNFTTAIRLNPQNAWAYNCRAVAQENLGNLTAAIADFRKALVISPGYANVYVNCGNLFRHHKESLSVAIADYSEAIRLEPAESDTYLTRADAYWSQRDFSRALGDYNTAVQLSPTNAECVFQRGYFEDQMTNYEAAARDYREAVRWNPNNAIYWSVCGDFHQRTTNYDAAVTDFTHCIKLQPTKADFYADRARVVESTAREFTRQGARETAKVALDRALDDWDQAAALNPEYVNDLGEFEGRKRQNESAIADFTECIQARPSEVRGWALRAAAYEREARYLARHGELAERNAALAKAFADWNQSVNLATNLLSLRGDFHARNQEFALALADFQQAAELQPPDEYSLISLAWFLATCPDKNFRNGHAALDAAKKACEMDGYQSGFYLAGLAAAYAEMGNFDQAVHFQKGALANKWYSDVLLPDMQHRLTLYEKGKPCHKILAEEE